jgi:hypothetical protein
MHSTFTLDPVAPNVFGLLSTRHHHASIGEKKNPTASAPSCASTWRGFNVNAKACRGVQEETENSAEQSGIRKLHQQKSTLLIPCPVRPQFPIMRDD